MCTDKLTGDEDQEIGVTLTQATTAPRRKEKNGGQKDCTCAFARQVEKASVQSGLACVVLRHHARGSTVGVTGNAAKVPRGDKLGSDGTRRCLQATHTMRAMWEASEAGSNCYTARLQAGEVGIVRKTAEYEVSM